MRRLYAALALVAVCLACSGTTAPNPLHGVIEAIEGKSMTVRSDGGDTFTFEIVDPNVTIEHLQVHRRDSLPILVTWKSESGGMIATLIADG